MVSLAHISDIHLAPLPPVKPWDLFNKRITGYMNWKLVREKSLNGAGLLALISHLRSQEVDFVAITGDLVNVALDAEIARASGWLKSVGPVDKVCVSPGNHDSYVPGAFGKARKAWGGYMMGETEGAHQFPFVRRIGQVAVVSCSSSVSTLPLLAAGRFGINQAERLASCLRRLGEEGLFRVVLIHHPPNVEARHWRLGLWGGERFREVIAQHGAELILHGHTHKSSMHTIHGPRSEVPVVGVTSAAAAPGGYVDDPARYNLFRIERQGEGWSCVLREYGFQRTGTDIIMRLQMKIY